MLSFEENEDLAWAKELLPTSSRGAQAHSDPLLEPSPPLPGENWCGPCAGLHYAALTAPGRTGTHAEHITDMLSVPRPRQRASCGAVRHVLLDLCKHALLGRPVAYGHAVLLATQEKIASSRWESSCARPTPSVPRSCARGSGAPAPSGAKWPTARSSRWWQPTWILSACSATPSGRVSVRHSARTFRKPRPGLSGSINLNPSPLSLLAPLSPPTGELSRVTCLAPSKVHWSWGNQATRTWASSSPTLSRPRASVDEWFVDDGQVFLRPWSFDSQELRTSALSARGQIGVCGVRHAVRARHR